MIVFNGILLSLTAKNICQYGDVPNYGLHFKQVPWHHRIKSHASQRDQNYFFLSRLQRSILLGLWCYRQAVHMTAKLLPNFPRTVVIHLSMSSLQEESSDLCPVLAQGLPSSLVLQPVPQDACMLQQSFPWGMKKEIKCHIQMNFCCMLLSIE